MVHLANVVFYFVNRELVVVLSAKESPEQLIKKPFNKCRDTLQAFEKHSRTRYHEDIIQVNR